MGKITVTETDNTSRDVDFMYEPLMQCNQSRRKVPDGFECDLTDASELGIDTDTLASVTVEYRCWNK